MPSLFEATSSSSILFCPRISPPPSAGWKWEYRNGIVMLLHVLAVVHICIWRFGYVNIYRNCIFFLIRYKVEMNMGNSLVLVSSSSSSSSWNWEYGINYEHYVCIFLFVFIKHRNISIVFWSFSEKLFNLYSRLGGRIVCVCELGYKSQVSNCSSVGKYVEFRFRSDGCQSYWTFPGCWSDETMRIRIYLRWIHEKWKTKKCKSHRG